MEKKINSWLINGAIETYIFKNFVSIVFIMFAIFAASLLLPYILFPPKDESIHAQYIMISTAGTLLSYGLIYILHLKKIGKSSQWQKKYLEYVISEPALIEEESHEILSEYTDETHRIQKSIASKKIEAEKARAILDALQKESH